MQRSSSPARKSRPERDRGTLLGETAAERESDPVDCCVSLCERVRADSRWPGREGWREREGAGGRGGDGDREFEKGGREGGSRREEGRRCEK